MTSAPLLSVGGPVRGLLLAVVAAVAGAGAWALLTGLTGYKIGFAAVGIGLLVGKAVEHGGGGDSRLPVPAAVIALLGCALGDLLADAHELAAAFGLSYGDVLSRLAAHPSLCVDVYRAGFAAFDLVFYAIAAYEGFRFAAIGVRRHQNRSTSPSPQPSSGPVPRGEEPAA